MAFLFVSLNYTNGANKKDRLLQYDLYKDNHAEILIGGNFNHVVNFSQWINEKLLMQTDISLVS
ncbi:hypothetical protein [Enterococcus faecium]|uniref:hypothetical protein n=1 Tax=Enterococcus faecium TaxID=1352 RepID=UPI0022E0BB90|nr:hypothetical protein [Enterococcus faecium]